MSNNNPHTLETVYRIWNDTSGERIEVGPDNDGLELIEIRSYTDDNKLGQSIILTRDQAELVIQALRQSLA